MKTYKEFCLEGKLNEQWWNPFSQINNQQNIAKPQQPKNVLAYQNFQSGVLNKNTNTFTQRPFTGPEQQRYGWKPVNVSSYSKVDTPGPLTASGTPWTNTTRGVAVPWKSPTNTSPSIDFNKKLQFTTAPGTKAPVVNAPVIDTGNFGKSGNFNKSTSFDIARQTASEIMNKPGMTSTEFGKRKVYVRAN